MEGKEPNPQKGPHGDPLGNSEIGPCRDPVPKPGILLDSMQLEIGKRDIKDIQISTQHHPQ